jgi:hypothetical protein
MGSDQFVSAAPYMLAGLRSALVAFSEKDWLGCMHVGGWDCLEWNYVPKAATGHDSTTVT